MSTSYRSLWVGSAETSILSNLAMLSSFLLYSAMAVACTNNIKEGRKNCNIGSEHRQVLKATDTSMDMEVNKLRKEVRNEEIFHIPH